MAGPNEILGVELDRDYFEHSDRLAELAEIELAQLGGGGLVREAHGAAGEWVNRNLPWDGVGEEPDEHVAAYTGVPWTLLEDQRDRADHT